MTLPLIYALGKTSFFEKRKIISTIKAKNAEPEAVNAVIESVENLGGIKYATEKMSFYRDKALEVLHTFQPGPMTNALEQLVHYTIERNK